MHGRCRLSSKQCCRCSPGPLECSSFQDMLLAISPRFKAIPLRGEVAGIWPYFAGFADVHKGLLYWRGLGTGRGMPHAFCEAA